MDKRYRRTLYACYIGYITQAIINTLAPLLFVTFQTEFQFTATQIGFLLTYNFCVQLTIDSIAAKYVDQIGYKPCIVVAHIFSAIGLVGLGIFPYLLHNSYAGLLLAVTIYALGGGLIEVLVSPIVEALPLSGKSLAMSLLHSFYCWGVVLVVILSTVFFQICGTANWWILSCLWAIIPFANTYLCANVPIEVLAEHGDAIPIRRLFCTKMFWILLLLMICSGASEAAMGGWSSYFAERGLHVSKAAGDLLGPCLFALFSGLIRWLYGTNKLQIPLEKLIVFSGCLCIGSYLLAAFSPIPILALAGCGICGLSIGILWPGTFSLSAKHYPQGGTAMFALLAMGGDIGCAIGPLVVGSVSEALGSELRYGLLAAIIFPLLLIAGINLLKVQAKST